MNKWRCENHQIRLDGRVVTEKGMVDKQHAQAANGTRILLVVSEKLRKFAPEL